MDMNSPKQCLSLLTTTRQERAQRPVAHAMTLLTLRHCRGNYTQVPAGIWDRRSFWIEPNGPLVHQGVSKYYGEEARSAPCRGSAFRLGIVRCRTRCAVDYVATIHWLFMLVNMLLKKRMMSMLSCFPVLRWKSEWQTFWVSLPISPAAACAQVCVLCFAF